LSDAPEYHPWLSTPEAHEAAEKALQFPAALMPSKAEAVGVAALSAVAFLILAECALPPREVTRIQGCDGAHIGSMWGWPEADRAKYAAREVGYRLNNYLRTRTLAAPPA
jgi:hypothetical protein